MRYEIILAPEAVEDLKQLPARNRATIKDAMEIHLRFEPEKLSKSRIKRLKGMTKPQYRLRVDDFRIFYDVREESVEILAIVQKSGASKWLDKFGEIE